MSSIFNRGAMVIMKERKEARAAQREVVQSPVKTQSLYRSFLDQDMAPVKPAEPDYLRSAPTPEPPSQGEKVFADQAQLDAAVTAVAPPSFGDMFQKARREGKAKFTYNGKRFHTMERDETEPQWQEALKDNKSPLLTDFVVGFERERDVEDIPPAKEVGNKMFPTAHPMNDRSNVRLSTIGGGPEPVRVIPTMVEGEQLTDEEARSRAEGEGIQHYPMFDSIEEGEKWNRANHGKISPEGILLSEDQEGGRTLLNVKNTRTAPTFKMLKAMEAPVETKATHAASARIVTDELNVKRESEGLVPLTMTSGYRSAQQNATAMMNNVEAAGSIEQARANGYTGKHYQKALKDYYSQPTQANLEAIGYIRMEREKVISGGHSGGDSADYSVKDLTNRADAVKRVAWLKAQGYKARLENWSGKNKGKNAHIHIDGIKHNG